MASYESHGLIASSLSEASSIPRPRDWRKRVSKVLPWTNDAFNVASDERILYYALIGTSAVFPKA